MTFQKYFENFSQSLQKRIFDNYGDQVVTLNDYYMKLQNGGRQIPRIYMNLKLLT